MSSNNFSEMKLGVESSKRLLPNIPVIKSSRPSDIGDSLLAVYDSKKYYFKKTIAKRLYRGTLDAELKPSVSMKQQLRISMLQREQGWDSRFIKQQIPEINAKQKYSVSKCIKEQDKILQEKVQELHKKLIRQSVKNMKYVMVDNKRYASSQGIRKLNKNCEPNEQTSQTDKQSRTIRQRVGLKNIQLRRDEIYNMYKEYIKMDLPNFEKDLIKEMFKHIRQQENINIMKFNTEQFKLFFESIDIMNKSVINRNQYLAKMFEQMDNIKKTNTQQNKLNQKDLMNAIAPFLLEMSILSLEVVEAVVAWREHVKSLSLKYNIQSVNTDSLGYYTPDNENYFCKMMTDNKPLFDMQLSPNARYPDPFFVSYPLSDLYEERDLLYKIRACQLAILEECMHS